MKHIDSFKMYEYRTGKKIKTRWTKDDAIITLYYEKFGLIKLGVTAAEVEGFVNEYIGSTESSLKMQALNIHYLLNLKSDEDPTGLPDYSKFQSEVVQEYGSLSEPELRRVVEKILDGVSDEDRLDNLIKAEEKRKEEEELKVKEIPEQPIPVNRFGTPLKKLSDLESKEKISVEVGDILDHKKFGEGQVTNVDGNLIEIKFFDGTSKLFIFNPKHYNWKEE